MNQLLAEHFIGEPAGADASQFMQRGTILEDAARKRFAYDNDVDVRQVGVCLTDDGMIAASPDGLVGENELLELKVPSASTMIAYLLDGLEGEYWSQLQGQLWVTGRKAVTLYAWNPVLPTASCSGRRCRCSCGIC
jgi:predicted phage-related endonuclease